ncbi:MAG: glycine cleavage system protein H [Candidatus Omnitrophica bacterium CG11_big_fil_rev_8_21_14_0_20_63_9]|nr:MAG: glycine cleavage system protein H [Candidatus Omnitrophica bacterium CG11_big_fil_rev_8_21_14_0_20_63_9]
MSAVPANLSYTKTHEWSRREGAELVVGITAHAQEELRDVVFVELPKTGRMVKQAEPAAVIESVKAAFDIYAPVSGTITRVNDAVAKSPQLVNQDCYGQGWLFAIAPSAPEETSSLLTADEYTKHASASAH